MFGYLSLKVYHSLSLLCVEEEIFENFYTRDMKLTCGNKSHFAEIELV